LALELELEEMELGSIDKLREDLVTEEA